MKKFINDKIHYKVMVSKTNYLFLNNPDLELAYQKLLKLEESFKSEDDEILDHELLNSEESYGTMSMMSYGDFIFGVKDKRRSYSMGQIFDFEGGSLDNMIVKMNGDKYLIGNLIELGENKYLEAYCERTQEIHRFRVIFEENNKTTFCYKGRNLLAYRSKKDNFNLVEALGYEDGNTRVKIVSDFGKGLEYKISGEIDEFPEYIFYEREVA